MVSNYCGISLLDVLSKILERQVYDEISSSMCFYRENPVSQLSQVVHQFANALERRQVDDI